MTDKTLLPPNEKTRWTKTEYKRDTSSYSSQGDIYSNTSIRPVAIVRDIILVMILVIVGFKGVYKVDEGFRAIVTQWGKAVRQEGPGLKFKIPFMEVAHHIEIRERKNVEELRAATLNRLPISLTVSVNWTPDAEQVMSIYKKYGSLQQFENRILDPKLKEAAKASVGKFNAGSLIKERQQTTAKMMEVLTDLLAGYPVTLNSPQMENIGLPQTYLDSVLAKEKAREDAEKEDWNLQKQALVAQQLVQTANAERDAQKSRSDGIAYALVTEAEGEAEATLLKKDAEAKGISQVQNALAKNPLFVDYARVQQWNGIMPKTILGGNTDVLLSVPSDSQ